MLVPKPPKESLVDTMVHKPFISEGDYNEAEYGEEKEISFVRIDRQPKFTFGPEGKQLLFNDKVFCYFGLTDPLPEFKEQDVLTFDGVEHTIISAAMFKEPFVDQIYSYELGVV